MSLIPYHLARPFLFNMEPEAAHDLTLNLLSKSQNSALSWAYCSKRVEDPVVVAGLRFPNRVGLAAGLDKNARCIDALGALGFGFVEVGTVTPLPQPGNPKPRMFRLPQSNALINRLGFNNDGMQAFVANVLRARFRSKGGDHPMLLGLNIGKNAATPIDQASNDYLSALSGVYPHADYVTVNISSPNTKDLRSLQSDEALDRLLEQLSERRLALSAEHGRNIPIFLKIAPDLDETQIKLIASTLQRYGTHTDGQANNSWGVIATNTTLNRDAVQGQQHAEETGGLSGAPVLAQSNAVIRQLRALLGNSFPIIGVGGILSAENAVSKIQAGADVVQIYTGLIYKGPDLVRECALALKSLRMETA
jgi:dihydroorotate dehydrogenase